MSNNVELQQMIETCTNDYEYDCLVDKLFLTSDIERNTKNKNEYSFYSAQVLNKKSKKELSFKIFY